MALKATYYDRAEHGGFKLNYKTDTPGCGPYYEFKMGADLTIFIDADRLKILEDALVEARLSRETAAIIADQQAMEVTA